MGQPITINVNGKEKFIGKVKDNIAVFPRQKSRHYFQKYDGWAVSKSVVDKLVENNIKYIGIKDTESKEKYLIETEKFQRIGKELTEKETGEDKQLVAPEQKFTKR